MRKKRDKRRAATEQGLCSGCQVNPASNGRTTCDACFELGKFNYRSRKLRVILAYGGNCRCCQETGLDFLCIDHIKDDGKEHRKEIGSSNIHSWLIVNNFPEGFQVLCSNCNLAKKINEGFCPHHPLVDLRQSPSSPVITKDMDGNKPLVTLNYKDQEVTVADYLKFTELYAKIAALESENIMLLKEAINVGA